MTKTIEFPKRYSGGVYRDGKLLLRSANRTLSYRPEHVIVCLEQYEDGSMRAFQKNETTGVKIELPLTDDLRKMDWQYGYDGIIENGRIGYAWFDFRNKATHDLAELSRFPRLDRE